MSGMSRCLAPLLLLAAVGAGDETGNSTEVTVTLGVGVPEGKVHLGYSRPREMALERTVPRFLFEVPKFAADDPLFFRLSLGETEGVPFYGALDRSAGGLYHDRLWLDRNRDLDLTNDGEPVEARIRTLWSTEGKLIEFLDVELELPYRIEGKETKEKYSCVVFFVLENKGGAKVPKTVLVERNGWRLGNLDLGGEAHQLVLVDDDSDGQFSTGDSWVVRKTGTSLVEMLDRDSVRTMLFPSWSEDQKWQVEVKAVQATGRTATLLIKPAEETEREYFLRIAKQRQTPEERRLNIDPLRPKAEGKEKVDWIDGKDARYALDIAAKPQVKKPVLLDFTGRRCQWCALMYRHTFTDREVVQLTKRFVCARVLFTPGDGDSAKYTVEGTPTYVILGEDGAEISRHSGFLRPTEFAAWLKSSLR